jgi:hypothetical protein
MMTLVSDIEGRLRIRDKLLKDSYVADAARKDLLDSQGITHVSINFKVGSMLILYEPSQITRTDVENIVFQWLKPVVADENEATIFRSPAPRMTMKRRKLVNTTMLSSLLVSLVLAALDAKKLHILSGLLFLSALGLHLSTKQRSSFI